MTIVMPVISKTAFPVDKLYFVPPPGLAVQG
jgi:hypothetical protein